jgi:hypothetical protein
LGTTPDNLLGVGVGPSSSSAQILQGRLLAAAAALSEHILQTLVVGAEAIVSFRSNN